MASKRLHRILESSIVRLGDGARTAPATSRISEFVKKRFPRSQFSITNSPDSLVALLALSSLLLLSGCFDALVKETMEIAFERDGTVVLRVDTVVADEGETPEMNQRLDEIRAELLEGRDAWARRFDRVNPKGESFSWAKEQGKLRQTTRIARMNPDELGSIFFDTSLQFRYHEERGFAQLEIYAGDSQLATREQIREYNEAADRWSHAVTGYYRALDELYRYANSYPDRAEGMFSIIFEEDLGDDDGIMAGSEAPAPGESGRIGEPGGGAAPPPSATDEERAMAERVVLALDEIIEAQGRREGRELSADALARLVNDPFPGELRIRPDGHIEDFEGFVPDVEAGGVRVERKGLLEALASMRGRWASPDPFHELLDRAAAGDAAPPFDLGGFLAQPREASPPKDWREVRAALDKALRPASTYRVRWQVSRKADLRIKN
ncbi:MAG: hypothetical protein NDJ92_06110 [Thermoanaerobaculia bacterium]|nr:hypothetical protein [Thermoanaerobaculia bacterium]